jgi:hypothetical protein
LDGAAVASHTHSTRQILQRNRGAFLAKNGTDTWRYQQKFFTTEDNMATNEAMVLSIEADVAPNTLRVSLQWQGDHDVSDFDLQRFGKVLRIQDETEHTGWAIIERRFHARIAHTLPGWALHESVSPLKAGDTIPLRRDFE